MTEQFVAAIQSRQWVLVSALAIGLVMKALRNPNFPLVANMSARVHAVIIVMAGAISAAADAVVNGADWGPAMLTAGVSCAIAGVALMQPPTGPLPPPPGLPRDMISTIPAPEDNLH